MNGSPDKLISLYLFDQASMSPEQVKELSSWILQQPENTRTFIRQALFHRSVHESFIRSDHVENMAYAPETDEFASTTQALNPEMWRLLSEDEKTAPSVCHPEPVNKPELMVNKAVIENTPWKISRSSVVSVLVSLAAMLFIVVYLNLVPATVHEEVAALDDMVDAVWADSSPSFKRGSRISTNTEPLMLRKGFARLTFDNGVYLLVEAPAEFVLVTGDQIKLNHGRIYADVPPQAIGFTVAAPNCKIIDLGTQFGVQVDFSRQTELHVIQGKTTLLADREDRKISLEVNEGSAKKITDRSSEIRDIRCDSELFVRRIQSEKNLVWRGGPLELADMIGGGNGLGTGSANTGIRWDNGKFASTADYYVGDRAQGTTDFIPVKGSPFIEGVFVPNSTKGPIQIAQSSELRWAVPDTPGQYCYNIHNSGTISRGSGRIPLHTQILDGQPCGTPLNPAISMHANAGVTFNLDEIRRAYQGLTLKSFSAVCGYSETFFEYAAKVDPELIPLADFYVLVDGHPRFSKVDMTPSDKACPILVELRPEDRFLTLVVTGGADRKISYDWCLFARPRIYME